MKYAPMCGTWLPPAQLWRNCYLVAGAGARAFFGGFASAGGASAEVTASSAEAAVPSVGGAGGSETAADCTSNLSACV